MFAVFLGLTIPIYITIVPVFVLLRTMGAIDSVPGLVGPYLAFGIPFEVSFCSRSFGSCPTSSLRRPRWMELALGESSSPDPAALHSCRHGVHPRRCVDLERVLFALILLSSDAHKTIPVGLLNFQASSRTTTRAGGRHLDRCRADLDRLHLPAALDCRWPDCRATKG